MVNRNYQASFADTADWRLMIYISSHGVMALLKNTEDVSIPLVMMFSNRWKEDGMSLLDKIEGCVYDNPRLLDDYATEIIVETPKVLHFPNAVIHDNPGKEEDDFCSIFNVDADDIFSDAGNNFTTLYTLTAGLPAFIRRTLPGAKVVSHLTLLNEKYLRRTAGKKCIFCSIHHNSVDILAYDNGNMLSASTQMWRDPSDIAYRISLLIDNYGLPNGEVEIYLSGDAAVKGAVADIMRDMDFNVALAEEPISVNEIELPEALAYLI